MPAGEVYVGLMSGTSMDGIDAVLASFEPTPRVIRAINQPWPEPLRRQMAAAAGGQALSAAELAQLDSAAGEFFARAAQEVLQGYSGHVEAIGSHGQTLAHGPDRSPAFSLQIGNPAVIAEQTGITTVADFRRSDIAAGGQGAPLVPACHAAMLENSMENRVILNIGGIANITVLPAAADIPVFGFDTGPGNCLLDAWIRRHRGLGYDREGSFAASGTVHKGLLERLLEDAYFALPPPKSTGTDYFSLHWLERVLAAFSIAPQDVQATLAALTATSIADAIVRFTPHLDRLLVCGGGVHNPVLISMLQDQAPCTVESTLAVGVDPDWVEAMAFAWLARETLARRPGNLIEVTGARHPVILGAIYPGIGRTI